MANLRNGAKAPQGAKAPKAAEAAQPADTAGKTKSVTTWDEVDESTSDEFTEELTFHISDVETKRSKTGNVGYRVTTDQGRVITFWRTTRDLCIETDEEGNCSLISGTTVADDGGTPEGYDTTLVCRNPITNVSSFGTFGFHI